MILRCVRILGTDAGDVLDGWVRIEDGRIAEVGAGAPPAPAEEVTGWLAPGFVDLHVHGGGGATFQTGRPEDVATAAEFHRRHGTTTLLASLVSAPLGDLAAIVADLAPAVSNGLLAGIHLEGPFLAQARCGAHDPTALRPPVPADLEKLLDAGPVRMVTLAPELPDGLTAVSRLAERGVVAAVGHTDASYEQVLEAVEAGARVATHLFNGMPPLHHRDPGPVLALLEDERVVVEVIGDGVHVHPALVRRLLTDLAPGRVALVTDAVAAAGLPDGSYQLGGLAVVVRDGVSRLAEGGSLAGSTLTMDAAVARAVRSGVAVPTAVTAATATPAGVLGREDIGRLAPGCRADLVMLDEDLTVARVWVAGEVQP